MERKTKTVKTSDLLGNERIYSFKLMTAEKAFELWHGFFKDVAQVIPFAMEELKGDDDIDIVKLLSMITESIPLDLMKVLTKEMLADCQVTMDGSTHETPESGIGEWADGSPLEVYTALYHAMRTNYDSMLAPFLASQSNDSSQD